MFREMRRKEKQVSDETALQFLDIAQDGVLSTISIDNGYPYSTSVNHVVMDGCIYFHCAKAGHKIDNILENNKVSFFAVAESKIDEKAYTTKFKSVHVFGRATVVTNKEEFKKALYLIAQKYTGSFFAKAATEIASAINKTLVVKIEIDSIKGKSSKNI
jgi:nitroimidazol reductase NimA-like FMN-containing flavoprotein (pyridoxamine 5'-phosphate oxidase superfamily)